jgi:hypothetical protein
MPGFANLDGVCLVEVIRYRLKGTLIAGKRLVNIANYSGLLLINGIMAVL